MAKIFCSQRFQIRILVPQQPLEYCFLFDACPILARVRFEAPGNLSDHFFPHPAATAGPRFVLTSVYC